MGHFLMPLLDPLAVLVLSAVPGVEMRGALLFAQYVRMDPFAAWLFALAGGAAGAMLAACGVSRAIVWARAQDRLHPYAERTKRKISRHRAWGTALLRRAKNERGRRALGFAVLFLLVVLPLPGMGGLTAALVGALLGMDSRQIFWPVFIGNLITAVCTVALADVLFRLL